MADTGIVNLHGKAYKTVALRVGEFRTQHPDWTIKTEIVAIDAETVLMRAEIISPDGKVIADGYAEERRAASTINKTSAVENCQTSAIGRALACFGLAGTEFASADEVANAISQQKVDEIAKPHMDYMKLVREWFTSIAFIKEAISQEHRCVLKEERTAHVEDAAAEWYRLPREDMEALWKAPSNGGIFTTAERDYIKENFRTLYHGKAA